MNVYGVSEPQTVSYGVICLRVEKPVAFLVTQRFWGVQSAV